MSGTTEPVTNKEYEEIYKRLQTYLVEDNFGDTTFNAKQKSFYLDKLKSLLKKDTKNKIKTKLADFTSIEDIAKRDEELWDKVKKVDALLTPVLFNHVLFAFLKSLTLNQSEKSTIKNLFPQSADVVEKFLSSSTQPVGNIITFMLKVTPLKISAYVLSFDVFVIILLQVMIFLL